MHTRIFPALTRVTFGKSHHTVSQSHITENCEVIDRIHKWRVINYSFNCLCPNQLIIPTSLVVKEYFLYVACVTILVALISTKAKEYSFGRRLYIRCIGSTPFELADSFRPYSENIISKVGNRK